MPLKPQKWLLVIEASDFGGAENEIIQLSELLLKMGRRVSICTRYRLDLKSSIIQYVQNCEVEVFSPIEKYWETWKGKLIYGLAYIRYVLKNKRIPTYRQESRLGEHQSRKFRENFWNNSELLQDFDNVLFIGEPIDWFASLYRKAFALNIPCFYRPSREIKTSDKLHQPYQLFLQHLKELTGMLVLGDVGAERAKTIYDFETVKSIILPPLQMNELSKEIRDYNKPLKFGIISRLVEGKRVLDSIKAMQILQNEFVELQIVGDGVLRKELETYVHANSLQSKVKFLGHIPNEKMGGFYSEIDVVLICSESEGGPLCGVEAAYLGLPIISTPVGILPEVYGQDYPLFYAIGNIDELAGHMISIAREDTIAYQHWVADAKKKVSLPAAIETLKQLDLNE